MLNKKLKGIIEFLIIVLVFLLFSYIVQENLEFFEAFVTNNLIGIIIYVLIEISSIVIAPITTLPLIAAASNLWGWIFTGFISVFAWTIGSWIAFFIGRKYGVLIIKKFLSIEQVYKIEKKIPKQHLFWSVVFLRMIIPVDVLSYALGIFTKMSTRNYIIATIIGITPFAFALAYLGTIPFIYQIISFLIASIIILIGWFFKVKFKKKK